MEHDNAAYFHDIDVEHSINRADTSSEQKSRLLLGEEGCGWAYSTKIMQKVERRKKRLRGDESVVGGLRLGG